MENSVLDVCLEIFLRQSGAERHFDVSIGNIVLPVLVPYDELIAAVQLASVENQGDCAKGDTRDIVVSP